MKLLKMAASAGAALALVSLATASHAASLVNGGFEQSGGSLAGWTVSGNVQAATGADYSSCCSTSGSEPSYSSNSFATFGAGDLGGANSISQSFATLAGKIYSLNFSYGALGGGSQALTATAGASSLLVNASANNNLDTTFSDHSLSFVGDGGVQTISFGVNSGSGDHVDGILDHVSISAVPEPSTWAIMLIGFAGLGMALRRSKSLVAATAA